MALYSNQTLRKANQLEWLQGLKDVPRLDLFTNMAVSSSTDATYSTFEITCPPQTYSDILRASGKSDVNIMAMMLTALRICLYRYAASNDVVIACPAFNFKELETPQILFIRGAVDAATSIEEAVRNERGNVIRSARNCDHDLAIAIDNFVKLGYGEAEFLFGIGLAFRDHVLCEYSKRIGILFAFDVVGDNLVLKITNRRPEVPQSLLLQFSRHLIHLLGTMMRVENQAVSKVQLMPDSDINFVLGLSRGESIETGLFGNSVIKQFEAIVAAQPDKTAIEFNGQVMSYADVNTRANQLALLLHSSFSVNKGDAVAVMLPRSEKCAVTLLAVLKSGGCYVPIDLTFPESRIRYIVEQVRPRVVIATEANSFLSDLCAVMDLDLVDFDHLPGNNPGIINEPEDRSFIIFTSGSTGNPKGVIQTHRTLTNLISWDITRSGLEPGLRQLQYASYSFDAALHDVLFALCNKGSVFIANDEQRLDLELLRKYIVEKEIEVMSMPFAPLNNFFKHFSTRNLEGHKIRHIISTGEQLLVGGSLAEFLSSNQHIRLHNFYGPTETHVVTAYSLTGKAIEKRPPIGRPIANTSVYVLDQARNLLPCGVPGEVYVGGANLAEGYLNNEQLTGEKFIDISLAEDHLEKVYRVGDIGFIREDGNIVYVGRTDHQVKIRGHRVELQEVEKMILQFPGVDGVAIRSLKDQDGSLFLVAYVSTNRFKDTTALRSHLIDILPGYMVPSFFVVIEKFPLTSNGKINFDALPDYKQQARQLVLPRNEIEKKLSGIWCEVLELKEISIDDDFFRMGGHSLKATQLMYLIHQQMNVRLSLRDLFDQPTIRRQAESIRNQPFSRFEMIPRITEAGSYETSHGQKRLWIVNQFESKRHGYILPIGRYLYGNLHVPSLIKAFDDLVARHEILRTNFRTINGELRQVVHASVPGVIAYVDATSSENKETLVDQLFAENVHKEFDLENGRLIRGVIIRTAEQQYLLFFALHHIVADGWSLAMLTREIILTYNALVANQARYVDPLEIQYKDFAAWSNSRTSTELLASHREYWTKTLASAPPAVCLPTDALDETNDQGGDEVSQLLGREFYEEVTRIGREQNASLFVVLTSIVKILLYRYTGEKDLVIGFPVSGRDHPGLEDQFGFYANTVVSRTILTNDESFVSVLAKVKSSVQDSLSHQDYPFDMVVNDLESLRDVEGPLFRVMIILDNTASSEQLSLHDVTLKDYNIKSKVSKFDVTFSFKEVLDDVSLSIEYNPSLFRRETIERVIEHLPALTHSLAGEPPGLVNTAPMMSEPERELLQQFSEGPRLAINDQHGIVKQFYERAISMSYRSAVLVGHRGLTYGELLSASLRVSKKLIDIYKIRQNDVVALRLHRSPNMIVAILGTLMAGGTYLPIDPDDAPGRITFLLEDSDARLLITDSLVESFAVPCPTLDIHVAISDGSETAMTENLPADGNMYMMYTSGTTGQPKGVKVCHRSVANFAASMIETLGIESTDRFLAVSAYTFDISVLELIVPLCAGAVVRLLENEERSDIQNVQRIIEEFKPTFMQATPTFWSRLVVGWDRRSPGLNVLSGGESLNQTLAARLLEIGDTLWNLYGPTETTIWSTANRIRNERDADNIGKPIHNTQVLIVDDKDQVVPIGSIGQICVGGEGVARGYHKRQQLSDEKFRDIGGHRFFKTGDIGKWLPDGRIRIYGRMDDQLKIRGYRIELGEIETLLLDNPSIGSAKAFGMTDEAGIKSLAVAYTSKRPIERSELIAALRERLPVYMIPSFFLEVEKIPMLSSGKADIRKLIGMIEKNEPDPQGKEHAEMDHVQRQVAEVWKNVLKKKNVSLNENFFQLGGHSIKAMELTAELFRALNVKVSLPEIFKYPNVLLLAQHITRLAATTYETIPEIDKQDSYPASHEQENIWLLSQLEQNNVTFNMPAVYILDGEVDRDILARCFDHLVNKYEILRTTFQFDQDGLKQRVNDPSSKTFKLQYLDLSGIVRQDDLLERYIEKSVSTPFDLANGPLISCQLLKLSESKSVLLLIQHHIISDQQSFDLLLREIYTVYHKFLYDQKVSLVSLKIQYKDYAAWQRVNNNDQEFVAHKAYWAKKLSGRSPKNLLSAIDSKAQEVDNTGEILTFSIEGHIKDELVKLCERHQCTLFGALLTCVNAVLYQYSNCPDIILGTTFSERVHPDLYNQLGIFINTVALRTSFTHDDSLGELLDKTRDVLLEAYDHHSYPFYKVVSDMKVHRDLQTSPLFNVVVQSFVEEDIVDNTSVRSAFLVKRFREPVTSKFDLVISFYEGRDSIRGTLRYKSRKFDRDIISALSKRLIVVAGKLVDDNRKPLRSLDLVGDTKLPPINF